MSAEGISREELQLAARNHGMPLEGLRYDVTPVGLHYLLIHFDSPAADETISVDGAAPFTESCQGMPAAAAYWALWIRPSADADWEYAQEGLGSLQLKPGQSVGLVFTTGTETPTPGS